VSLPLFAEFTLGSTVELDLLVRDENGVAQADPTITVLAQLEGASAVELDVQNEVAEFSPDTAGLYNISIRVTEPVQVVREGRIRVRPSVVT
jgi:hypothetical protein